MKFNLKKHIYNPFLKDFQEYGDIIELSFFRKWITENVLIHIGFALLQYAKLRMLEFYYNFLRKYLDWNNFQLIQMDTESFYNAISEKNIINYSKLKVGFQQIILR